MAMRPKEAPMANDPQQSISIAVSLGEIYGCLCPSCRDALVALLAAKAGNDFFRQAIHNQLVGATLAAPPDGPAGAPF